MQCEKCKKNIEEANKFGGYCGENFIGNKQVFLTTEQVYVQADKNKEIKSKKKKKNRILKFLLFLFVIFLINKGIDIYKKTLDNIYITNSEIYGKSDNENFYTLKNKVDKISLKVKTLKKVKQSIVKLYAGNLVVFEKEYSIDKKFVVENLSLPLGTSFLEIKVTLDNGVIIERIISLYNTSTENLGNLDVNDDDDDKILNYQEQIYGTNKLKADTDEDGLTDCEELNFTKTNPTIYSTYQDGVSDYSYDYDLDGLKNSEELKLNTNPILSDTDGDGLTDYEEFKNGTSSEKKDTDRDGVSDYDEVKNYNTNPLTKTTIFSGKVENKNREISIELNNISLQDIEDTKFEESNLYQVSESMVGYIMPAYDISTSVSFSTSKITFNFENYTVDKNVVPVICYFNEKTQSLEQLPTTITGTKATSQVTHFSTYVLIDKNKLDKINQIDVNTSKIKTQQKIDGEFIFMASALTIAIKDKSIKVIASPNITESQANMIETKLNSLGEGVASFELEIAKSRHEFNSTKKRYDLMSNICKKLFSDVEVLYRTLKLGEKSYVNTLMYFIFVGYFENLNALSSYFAEDYDVNIFEENYVMIDLDDKTDTNNDGITDSETLAIMSGAISTPTGINPFEGYSLFKINENDDLDKDGLKNGEEIKILEKNEKYYIEMISNPTIKDTDGDGIEDSKDLSALQSEYPGFTTINSLNENLDMSYFNKKVKEYNSVFGTGKEVKIGDKKYIEYYKNGQKKYSPTGFIDLAGESMTVLTTTAAILGNEIGAGDAEYGRRRYFEKTAETYTEKDIIEKTITKSNEINKHSIFGSEDVQEYLKENTNKIIEISEKHLKEGKTVVLKTEKPLKGSGGSNQNTNVLGFLHSSSSHMIAEITNKNNQYTMKLRYFIIDVYDWKNSDECDLNNSACVTEVQYYNEMLLGNAKAFAVKIEYDIEYKWRKGTEPVMKLQDGTPYK